MIEWLSYPFFVRSAELSQLTMLIRVSQALIQLFSSHTEARPRSRWQAQLSFPYGGAPGPVFLLQLQLRAIALTKAWRARRALGRKQGKNTPAGPGRRG